MQHRSFILPYLVLALVAGATAMMSYGQLVRPAMSRGTSQCEEAAGIGDPLAATRRFISTAVEREHLERSYGLVTTELRQGLTCSDWLTGTIPVQPFLEVSWPESVYRVIHRSRGERLVVVHLVSRSPEWPATTFLLELRSTSDGWVASSWAPAASGAVPSSV